MSWRRFSWSCLGVHGPQGFMLTRMGSRSSGCFSQGSSDGRRSITLRCCRWVAIRTWVMWFFVTAGTSAHTGSVPLLGPSRRQSSFAFRCNSRSMSSIRFLRPGEGPDGRRTASLFAREMPRPRRGLLVRFEAASPPRYVYGPGDLPIEQTNSENHVQYLHHDQQGSTRLGLISICQHLGDGLEHPAMTMRMLSASSPSLRLTAGSHSLVSWSAALAIPVR